MLLDSGTVLRTPRLLLRCFSPVDAPQVQQLAGHPAVADTTLRIPHPYPDGAAESWIASHAAQRQEGTAMVFALVRVDDREVVGAVGLRIERDHSRAELGYWVGRPWWGRGYATEAARAVLDYAFGTLELNRVHACHFGRNPASGKVMANAGMLLEGTRPGHLRKGTRFEDLVLYGLTRAQWQARQSDQSPPQEPS